MNEPVHLYPLRLIPLAVEKIWGGQKLRSLLVGQAPAGEAAIGELWAIWERLVVSNGPWQGRTLREIVDQHPHAILGTAPRGGGSTSFPLLVKLIDAHDTLSVQVHPDDEYARARENQPFGKTEMWYILEAEPGARIIHGVKRHLEREELRLALERNRLEEELESVAVRKGDTVFLPAGTIHALGKGIMVYELQQSSDLTYRLYDWGRTEGGVQRELHIEKSLDVARLDPTPFHKIRPLRLAGPGFDRVFLCACRYFAAELLEAKGTIAQRTDGGFHILTALDEGISIRYSPSSEQLAMGALETILIPAGLGEYRLEPAGDRMRAMKGYVPDLRRDVALPLLEAGAAPEDVAQLGGDPRFSDLSPIVGVELH